MSQRHATDVISLVFGTIFAGIAIVWALRVSDVIDGHQIWLAGPVILIAAGAIGLVGAVRSQRQSPGEPPAPWQSGG
jgi:hypothetical protein